MIELNELSLIRHTSGKITGEIFFHHDGICFPEEKWSDFPEIILNWWADEILALLDERSDKAILRFMDGPYYMKIKRTGLYEHTLEFYERDKYTSEMPVDIRQLAISLKKCINKFLRVCKKNDWNGIEIDSLNVKLISLQTKIKQI